MDAKNSVVRRHDATFHEPPLQRGVLASDDAFFRMPLNIRTYHELTEPDRSGLPGQIAAQRRRETLEAAALREFLADVAWGALDRLLVDLPPGIQRFQELAELLPAPPAVLTVTIPTTESRDAVRRAMQFARERGAELLGVVENMVDGPFTGDAGEALAREFAIPLVARVPFNPNVRVWDELAQRMMSSS